jgi:hypothetical protein
VRRFGGSAVSVEHGHALACRVHGHDHGRAWAGAGPVDDLKSFWGALGCSCFAF